MPSILLGNVSGGQLVLSGCPWSGNPPKPDAGIQLVWDVNASGACYIALSGASGVQCMTVNSGTVSAAGVVSGGAMDGLQIARGGSFYIPRLGTGLSGQINVFAACDAAASGQARLYFEIF